MLMFIYGEDTFRSRQKLKEFKDAFIAKYDPLGSSLVVVEGESLNLNKFNEATAAASLFSKKRMIVIENIFSAKNKELTDQLTAHLKNKDKKNKRADDDNVMIFWQDTNDLKLEKNKLYQFLTALPNTYAFPQLSNTDTADWVKKEFSRRGAKIKPAAVNQLTGMFMNNLWQLNNEIDKLIGYKSGQTGTTVKGAAEIMIDLPDVTIVCRGPSDANIFALTDAISNNQKARALELFEIELEAGVNEIYLLTMIQRQFRILLQVRQALDLGYSPRKIMSELKMHPFVAQKAINQVRNFSLPVLKRIFQALVNIDRQVKSGLLDLTSALDILLAKI